MKETRFIAQNKEKWLESETLLTQERKEPEKLSNLFTQVVDDLSYSRTYYPNRSVRVYLNKIAREYFSIIYSRSRSKKNTFVTFWLEELPQIVIHCRRELIVALLFFFLCVGIGVFSAMKDPQFTTSIMGEEYVEMTKANIEKGDPMAVYKRSGEADMVLAITWNNLKVAFYIYIFGIFASIGSLAILMSNGIMVGCFQYFFIEQGLFAESALTIWLHGTLEMSAFVIAGGAGITLGSGLVFPGTYSRLQAFQLSAIRSLKLLMGIAPIIIFAAIIESFLTRYTEVPDFVRFLLILASLTFIIGYFVVYPWMKAREGFRVPIQETKIAPSNDEPVNFKVIKNNAELLRDAFLYYKRRFSQLFPWIVGVAVVIAIARFTQSQGLVTRFRFIGDWWQIFFGELFYGMETPNVFFIVINAAASAIILYAVYRHIAFEASGMKEKVNMVLFLSIFTVTASVFGILYALGGWGVFILVMTYVIVLLMAFAPVALGQGLPSGLSRSWSILSSRFVEVFVLQVVLMLITFSFLIILSAPLIYMYMQVFKWNFAKTDTWINDVFYFIEIFIKVLSFYMTLPILAACSAYLYYSLAEILDAAHLRSAIDTVGTKVQKYSRR